MEPCGLTDTRRKIAKKFHCDQTLGLRMTALTCYHSCPMDTCKADTKLQATAQAHVQTQKGNKKAMTIPGTQNPSKTLTEPNQDQSTNQ